MTSSDTVEASPAHATDPATPEFQTSSLPLGPTTPGKSRNDFETSSADFTLRIQRPQAPYFATTANISTIIATAATGEQSEIDDDSGFSDITGDVTSPEPGSLEPKYSNYLFPCDDEELLEREPLTHEAIWRLRKYHAKSALKTEHLHLDPFEKNPQKAIELGAGICLWANDCS
ncbi:hypothetical protein B0O99DRAFT_694305 [Bisporella sp. PMI_857]|nr:hypothetical protein B0O99DRAFT_694305 [Bisporella sp. PMI_857]